MKNSIAIRRQTYGSALNDCTNVHSNIRIVYPCRSNLINLAARNSRKKPKFSVFACIQKKWSSIINCIDRIDQKHFFALNKQLLNWWTIIHKTRSSKRIRTNYIRNIAHSNLHTVHGFWLAKFRNRWFLMSQMTKLHDYNCERIYLHEHTNQTDSFLIALKW